MNKITLKLYFLIFFLYSLSPKFIDSIPPIPRTIFSLEPLTTKQIHSTLLQTYILYLQNAILPLSICFFCTINQNNILVDIIKNPYTTVLFAYCAIQYNVYTIQKSKQKADRAQLKKFLQEVFYLLIIGHGIRNLIIQLPDDPHKASHANTTNFDILDTFLHKTHDLWMSLFLKYKADFKNESIIIYYSDEITSFDILQAACHDKILMDMIVNFYQKISSPYYYHNIIEYLEKKFIVLNNEFRQI